jgi:hypothetical protein
MSNWAIQRARFNHDKLKNQFLQSVVRLVRALEARTLDQEFVDDFICQLPSNWAKLETKALDLLDRAESETGPPAWFRTYPLSRLNSEDRLWREDSLTREWRAHGSMSAAVDHGREALNEAREQCRKLEEAFLSPRLSKGRVAKKRREEDCSNQELLDRAVGLHQSCQRLGESFHALVPDDPIRVLKAIEELICPSIKFSPALEQGRCLPMVLDRRPPEPSHGFSVQRGNSRTFKEPWRSGLDWQ